MIRYYWFLILHWVDKHFQILLLSSLPAFPWGLRGQQIEIEPPHLTVFHHLHHFAWVNSQAVPSKILKVIGPSSSRSSNWSSPICFGKLSLYGESFLRHSAYMAKPSKLRSFNSEKYCNGSILRDFRISELRTLLNSVTPSIFRKNLISDACTCDRSPSVIIQDSWP